MGRHSWSSGPSPDEREQLLLALLDREVIIPRLRAVDEQISKLIGGLAEPRRDLADEQRRVRRLLDENEELLRLSEGLDARAEEVERQRELLTHFSEALDRERRQLERQRGEQLLADPTVALRLRRVWPRQRGTDGRPRGRVGVRRPRCTGPPPDEPDDPDEPSGDRPPRESS